MKGKVTTFADKTYVAKNVYNLYYKKWLQFCLFQFQFQDDSKDNDVLIMSEDKKEVGTYH